MAEGRLFVNTKDESPRLFDNNFLDFFSRIPFWVPIIIYVPAVVFFSWLSFEAGIRWYIYMGLIVSGAILWTLAEYLIHRFLFHFHPKGKLLKRIHFIFHGVHHDYPQDSLRLVMPPIVSIPLATAFYYLFVLCFNAVGYGAMANAFFAGFIGTYLFYDLMHYATHHLNWKNAYFQAIKEHHMKHHYKNPDVGFGFTSKTWDIVFRTDFEKEG